MKKILLLVFIIILGLKAYAETTPMPEQKFEPYMNKLQKTIKGNWKPPKGDESKQVILLFKVAKDGKLLSNTVYKSSGSTDADSAAIKALEMSAPFDPLPEEFKGKSIDVQFTFDYNVHKYGPGAKNISD